MRCNTCERNDSIKGSFRKGTVYFWGSRTTVKRCNIFIFLVLHEKKSSRKKILKNSSRFFFCLFDIEYERFTGVPWHRVWTIQSCFMAWGIIDSNCSMTWRLNDQFWTLFHDKEYERSKLFHDLKCERFKTVPWLKVWTVQSHFMRWTIKACLLSSTVCFFHPHDSSVKGTAKTSFVRCNH